MPITRINLDKVDINLIGRALENGVLTQYQKAAPIQSTPPEDPTLGLLWIDTTDPLYPLLKVYNGEEWKTLVSATSSNSLFNAEDDQIILASRIFG